MPDEDPYPETGRQKPLQLGMALAAVTFAQLASSFGIQWYTVTQLGAGAETDGLYAAFTLPQIVMVALIDPLGFVLTPLLAVLGEKERRILGAQVVWLIAGCAVLIAMVALVLAPVTVPALAPGFPEATVHLTVGLARIQAVALVGAACTMALSCLYHAGQRFLWPACATLMWSLVGWLILVVGIRSGGVTLAAWVQVVIYAGPVVFLASPLACWPWSDRSRLRGLLSEVWRQYKPLMLSAAYYRTGFTLDRMLTSLLAPGSIVILELAWRIHLAIVRVLNQGMTTPIVPVLAGLSSRQCWPAFKSRYWERMLWIAVLSFGTVVGLVSTALVTPTFHQADSENPAIGSLRWQDLDKLIMALVAGSGIALFGGMNHLMASAFYAHGDTRTPTRIQLLSYSLGIVLKAGGFLLAGLYGMMAAMSIWYAVETLLLGVALDRRLNLRLRAEPHPSLGLSAASVPPRFP